MTRELVLRIQRTRVSLSSRPLLKRTTLSTLNVARLIHCADVLPDMNLSKDPETLGARSCSKNVLSLESKIDLALLALRGQHLRFVALYLTNLDSLPIFISDGVCGAQGVDVSLCHELCLCDIAVVVSGEAGGVLALLMSKDGLGPWNVIDLVGFLGLRLEVPVFLGVSAGDIRNVHLIADEFGRRDGPGLYLGQVVHGVQRVVPKTVSCELHTLGGTALNISVSEIVLWLIQLDVKCCGLGPGNVPICVGELGLVDLFRPVKSWRSSYKIINTDDGYHGCRQYSG